MRTVLEKALQFVVGKGGVGKSTITAALALAVARTGRRVLAAELGEPGGLARIFGRSPEAPGEPLEVRPGLAIAYVDGEAALAEYLELVVPIRRLLATVFASRIYRYFVAAAPGLKELMTIGKIWYEHEKTAPNGDRLWDAIVVDAGASGHSLQYLHMPTTAAQTFRSGLVHREATRVASLLKDDDATAVHVVAAPEEMPLTEAAQIIERLRTELQLPVGTVFVNRCREPSPPGARRALDCLEKASLGDGCVARGVDPDLLREGVRLAASRALAWEAIQESGLGRFQARTGLTPVRLPLLASEEFGLVEVQKLASLLAESALGASR